MAGLLILVGAIRTAGQDSATPEYRIKATFLSQIPNFVEWPADAFATADAPFLICVYGEFAFGTSLAESIRGRTVRGRKLQVRWLGKLQEATACQILFVSHSEQRHYALVKAAVGNLDVLTVGETVDFLGAGGVIYFSFEREVLRFEVNLEAATEARLKMSARLLVMARRVFSAPETAKG